MPAPRLLKLASVPVGPEAATAMTLGQSAGKWARVSAVLPADDTTTRPRAWALTIALATAATLALVHSTDELRLRLMTSARRTPVDSPDAQLMPAAIAAKVGLPVPEILTGTRVQFQHTPTPPLPLARAPTMPATWTPWLYTACEVGSLSLSKAS
jgi:hypothetical protein